MIFSWSRNVVKVVLVTLPLLLATSGVEIIINQGDDSHKFRISNPAQAQEYNEEKLRSYAAAVLAIEPLRQRTFQEIQTLLDTEQVPTIACNRFESYRNLSADARSLITNYCDRSKEIVLEKGLTVLEFNSITADVNSNPELKEQVQAEMLELQ